MGLAVGVFGGAFDPPHVGHVELARRGIEHFGLAMGTKTSGPSGE